MDEISLTSVPDESRLSELSDFFRIFGDQTRLRILYALAKNELCVCDLAKLLGAVAVGGVAPIAGAALAQARQIPP